ncbi:hypothetical protein [Streptomyces ipomoeae]|uniref:hypothetical protein n=1 Tax=Streptomyces ipomoeae TaxID=103232 RepID=UPI001146905A|nr:hypothetical protein [Streptomyces ipomoeae]TQE33108.1 hypothetical protein Sipo7851_21660 [Streptomyces ipomoeae]
MTGSPKTATTAQGAFGDREAPIPTTPDTVPSGCYWWTDPDGDLCLMPGCMARVQDPAAECTCDKLASRLRKAEEKLQDHQKRQSYANTWWHALSEAVNARPDAAEILADARQRAGR